MIGSFGLIILLEITFLKLLCIACFASPPITSKKFEMEVREGLTFVLNHSDGLWARMVSTYATKGAQREVKNFEEAMAWFKAANFLDCRISAYPKYTDHYITRTGIAPTVLMVDIDKEHFTTAEEFELAVTKTYNKFYDKLGSRPTILSTGGGVHFLTPQQVPVFEKWDRFKKFDQPSRNFLKFEERLLTDSKACQSHWSTVSFNNCMLRIPNSINSKLVKFDGYKIVDIPYDARVRIREYWDGNTPIVGRTILMEYYNYLQFGAIKNVREQKIRESYRRTYGKANDCVNIRGYNYIEKLLNKPLDDFRKFCIWRIFVPYFINIKRMPRLEAFNRTKSWLDKCNSIRRLDSDFNPRWKIDYALDHVGTYPPIPQDRLQEVNKPFYERLKGERIIS